MSIPAFARLVVQDILPLRAKRNDYEVHLHAAIQWLCRAHDKTLDGGVSYGFSIRGGWKPSYRETSGYILTTFYNLAEELERYELRDRAIQIAHWLCDVQNLDGSFSNQIYHESKGIVFDTGQALFGLVRAYRESGDEQFLEAVMRAGHWLAEIADENGRWTRNTHLGIPHVYNTKSAWALLQLNQINPSEKQERVARSNLDWAISQERNGFFDQCSFEANKAPFTHTIAYAIRGLWESSIILDEKKYSEAALLAAKAMLRHVRGDGFIPGQIDREGVAQAQYCCLTGNAQMAIIWAKLYLKTGDQEFKNAAVDALQYVMRHQDVDTKNLDFFGAIKGSYPIWGGYSPLTFPNWPTKFFVDALLLCRNWL